MPDYRQIVLYATREAARLHRERHVREEVEETGGKVDVFGIMVDIGVPLLFRPLSGLLGAYITNPSPGILLSTQRQLAVQRFSGAHELGHHILGHSSSLDGEEILHRSPFSGPRYDPQEIEADAFASQFLMPRWMMQVHAARQGWSVSDMSDPITVYQLSLRVGASYTAICYALEQHRLISRSIRTKLLAVERRKIKEKILDGVQPETWRPDVWVLTPADEGTVIEGGPNDLFVLRLKERTSGGFMWNVDELKESGFAIVRDNRQISSPDKLGSAAVRIITTQSLDAHSGHLSLRQTRPWQGPRADDEAFQVDFDLHGKEVGLPRAWRKQQVAA